MELLAPPETAGLQRTLMTQGDPVTDLSANSDHAVYNIEIAISPKGSMPKLDWSARQRTCSRMLTYCLQHRFFRSTTNDETLALRVLIQIELSPQPAQRLPAKC